MHCLVFNHHTILKLDLYRFKSFYFISFVQSCFGLNRDLLLRDKLYHQGLDFYFDGHGQTSDHTRDYQEQKMNKKCVFLLSHGFVCLFFLKFNDVVE